MVCAWSRITGAVRESAGGPDRVAWHEACHHIYRVADEQLLAAPDARIAQRGVVGELGHRRAQRGLIFYQLGQPEGGQRAGIVSAVPGDGPEGHYGKPYPQVL